VSRRQPLRSRVTLGVGVAVLLALSVPPVLAQDVPTAGGVGPSAVSVQVRVNQVGYAANSDKSAYLMSSTSCAGQAFDVVDGVTPVFSGNAGPDRGPWNAVYGHVCRLTFTPLATTGSYTLSANGSTSAPFRIDTAANLYRPLVANSVTFYQAQRDGAGVIRSVLSRRPAHLNDRHARVYSIPRYRGETLQGDLHPVGGRADVAGGWFDAGDFIKFTGTTSFSVGLMLTALRDDPAVFSHGGPALNAEARRGVHWLMKMYDDKHRVVYYQVGIGNGNAKILSDHDLWRLPQRDDAMKAHNRRYIAHRPVFRAGPPGSKVAPSLAGRLAAVFGLCAQVWKGSPLARRCLRDGAHVLALARTTNVGVQVTASPVDYYREPQWRDDVEWGATELARARRQAPAGVGVPAAHHFVAMAARWANAYRHSPGDGGETLNLYDVSGLAHADLIATIRHSAGGGAGLAIGPAGLLRDLRNQLDSRARRSRNDPFGFGAYQWDPTPHAFGLVTQALAYDRLSGTSRYAALARNQLDWTLGANAWGSSFVVGAGSTFPHCMQHVVANLVGSTDGTSPLLLGATVDGPSDYIPGPGFFGNAVKCPNPGGNPFKSYDQGSWRYVDRVSSWATVEPSLDYTALSMLAFVELSNS